MECNYGHIVQSLVITTRADHTYANCCGDCCAHFFDTKTIFDLACHYNTIDTLVLRKDIQSSAYVLRILVCAMIRSIYEEQSDWLC